MKQSKKTESANEEFKVDGEDLVRRVKDIIRAGNARQIIIRTEKGEDLLVIPLTVGVVGTLLLPMLAAVGALAAFVTKCSIIVVKKD
jgi:hypothetical protein